MERRVVALTRDCEARLVPTGDEIKLAKDTFVTLTQQLGGTFTVVYQGNMARIAGTDADALGLPQEQLVFSEEAETPAESHVWYALSTVYDPEIPVDIVELGLIYGVQISKGDVSIDMTLTAPGCGMGPVLVAEVEERVAQAPDVDSVTVNLTFDPPWSRDMMSEAAQLELGVF